MTQLRELVRALGAAAILLFVSGNLCSQVSADTLLPPAQGGRDTIGAPVSVKKTLGRVVAATGQDAMNAASGIDSVGGGMATWPGGIGFYGTGEGSYDLGAGNIVARRISKRQAYLAAFLMAKSELAKVLSGMTSEARESVKQDLLRIDTVDAGRTSMATTSKESVFQTVEMVMQGYVLWKVRDDVKRGVVSVTVCTTPSTRASMQRLGDAYVETTDLRSALDRVLTDIKSGLVPPLGCYILNDVRTGEIAVVGFGSDVVRVDKSSPVQRSLNLVSQRRAKMRASAALCQTLIGDRVAWNGRAIESTEEAQRDFELSVDTSKIDPAAVRILDKRRETFASSMRQSDVWSSVSSGKLPPGVIERAWFSEGNEYSYALALYMPSITAASSKAAQEMVEGGFDSTTGKPKSRAGGLKTIVDSPDDKVRQGPTGKRQPGGGELD